MPKQRGFCFICHGSNDGRSDICTRPACLAKYWWGLAENVVEQAQRDAAEYIKRAKRIEADAKLEPVRT